jgi:hypothetical protein
LLSSHNHHNHHNYHHNHHSGPRHYNYNYNYHDYSLSLGDHLRAVYHYHSSPRHNYDYGGTILHMCPTDLLRHHGWRVYLYQLYAQLRYNASPTHLHHHARTGHDYHYYT